MVWKLAIVAVLFASASAKEPCCKKCELPLVKYFSTDAPHGFCGEACMDPKKFDLYHHFEANLTLATSDNPCSEQWTPSNTKHFTDYFDTVTHGGFGLTCTLDLYAPTDMPDHSCCDTPLFSSLNCVGIPGKPTSLSIFGTGPYCCPEGATAEKPCASKESSSPETGACQTYRKIGDGSCGDICLDEKVGICPRSIVVKTGGLEAGKCADAGYTQSAGEMDQKAGPCGTLKIQKWEKPTNSIACQTYRKIGDAGCGDICLDDKVGICPRSIVVKTGGLEAGKCADAGYTQSAGEMDQKAGPCGTLKIQKWEKPTDSIAV